MTVPTVTLPVAEVFGPVWQGEGPAAGRRCGFVRLGHCNLSCEWCDTPYTWDTDRFDVAAECPPTDAARVVSQIDDMDVPMVVLTGGEPLIHQRVPAWATLLFGLRHHEVHVETNGTISPTPETVDRVDLFVVSPKINTHDPEKRRLHPAALTRFVWLAQNGKAVWKFVCATPEDVATAAAMCDKWDVPAPARWVMPEGTTPTGLLMSAHRIADAAAAHGFNLTLRQQTLMYGARRGV